VFVDSISLNITPVSTISSTMTDGGQYGLFYSGYSPLLIDSLTATNNANIGIWAVLDTSSYLTSNSVTAVSSYLTGNREGINIASTNALYLTSNNILLANNIINNNLIGVKATNVAGVVSGNTFNFNTEDLNLTIGNNSTVINNNSATTHLSIADYKHLNITGGINYKDINVHTNTITLSDYNIV
jgi:hypothetical protein